MRLIDSEVLIRDLEKNLGGHSDLFLVKQIVNEQKTIYFESVPIDVALGKRHKKESGEVYD